eukprot:g1101.t1
MSKASIDIPAEVFIDLVRSLLLMSGIGGGPTTDTNTSSSVQQGTATKSESVVFRLRKRRNTAMFLIDVYKNATLHKKLQYILIIAHELGQSQQRSVNHDSHVHNKRKRQEGGDTAAQYFNCTSAVAGVEDVRFQSLMPDALHWLGIKKIDNLVSMSNMKYDAIVSSGIEVKRRVPIPAYMVPADAQVEIQAKVFAGYEGGQVFEKPTNKDLESVHGRTANDFFGEHVHSEHCSHGKAHHDHSKHKHADDHHHHDHSDNNIEKKQKTR